MTTFVPQPVFLDTGYVIPTEQAILTGVKLDINAAFGGKLNFTTMGGSITNPTSQGQLASSLAAIVGDCDSQFLFTTQMFDPAYSFGRYQDAIARIYFIERNPAQPTVVQCLCTGSGATIPIGAIAVATDGNRYISQEQGTLPVLGGSITLPFECTVVGPVPCPAGTVNQIYLAISGWDTITNVADGVLGNNVEGRADFERRRGLSVAQNSLGSLPSVVGAVLNVANVIDAYVVENVDDNPQTIGGVSLAPHSLYVSVVGGAAADVARAIWSRKGPGCAYNGNTHVTVLDTNPAYSPPFPSYSVSFDYATPLPLVFNVSIFNSIAVPADAKTQIAKAIVNASAGLDGGNRLKIGTKVLASRFYAPVAALGSWVQTISIEVGSTNAPNAVFVGSITGTTLTVSSVTSGTIAVGQHLFDTTGHVVDGTTIISGSGLSWQVSNTQTVGSETMKAVAGNLFDVPVNINQIPVIAQADVDLTLV